MTRPDAPVFPFDHPHHGAGDLTALLGGKGAALAELTRLGLPVPAGFTLGVPVFHDYRAEGWPGWLDEELDARCADLERRWGARFGDPDRPLLVSVRAGAPESMPGALDTILNLGCNPEVAAGLVASGAGERFAWDTYLRFLLGYGRSVFGLHLDHDHDLDLDHGEPSATTVTAVRAEIERRAGEAVPDDPATQLRVAVRAVFASWDSRRARVYRERENIAAGLGTAVTVQAMVFGNAGGDSGTGVVFTRDPVTGADRPFGEFLPGAQGEDVVSGRSGGLGLAELARRLPRVHAQLLGYLRLIEVHHRDLCEVEFTVDGGRLWLLQSRIAKRSPLAAVRVAVAMTTDPAIRLTEREAVARVPEDLAARAEAQNAGGTATPPLTTGVAGSPGRATGRAVFDPDEAAEADDEVILVRRETSPEDMHGIAAAAGLLTARGGPTSHAAVVAREWGIPAVVGAVALEVSGGEAVLGDGVRLPSGAVVTIDGGTGEVWAGAVAADRAGGEVPELAVLRSWYPAQSGSDDRSMPSVTRKSS